MSHETWPITVCLLPCAAAAGGWRDLLREIASLKNSCGVFPGLGGAASTRGSSAAKSRTRQFRLCVHHKFMVVWSVNGLALSRKYSIPVGNAVG